MDDLLSGQLDWISFGNCKRHRRKRTWMSSKSPTSVFSTICCQPMWQAISWTTNSGVTWWLKFSIFRLFSFFVSECLYSVFLWFFFYIYILSTLFSTFYNIFNFLYYKKYRSTTVASHFIFQFCLFHSKFKNHCSPNSWPFDLKII